MSRRRDFQSFRDSESLISEMIEDLQKLLREVRYITDASHGQKVVPRPEERGDRSKTFHSDPTGSSAVNLEDCRAHLRRFRRDFNRASGRFYDSMSPAFEDLHAAYMAYDSTYERAPNRLDYSRIKVEEYREAKGAQQRRRKRGEL